MRERADIEEFSTRTDIENLELGQIYEGFRETTNKEEFGAMTDIEDLRAKTD